MKKVAVLFHDGFEEVEALSVVDIMRRANVECTMVGMDKLEVTSSHQIKIKMDQIYDGLDNYDAVVIPGGMPGSTLLRDNNKISEFFKTMYNEDKLVAAICAAPIVLSAAGILKDKEATSYPGFDKELECQSYNSKKAVVVDKNVITAQGPAVAILFGYEIVNYLLKDETANTVKEQMLLPVLKNNI